MHTKWNGANSTTNSSDWKENIVTVAVLIVVQKEANESSQP